MLDSTFPVSHVDAHVHLEEPPLSGKGSTADNFETEIR